jgi:uncharacterized DUF497 family protein
MHFEWDPNKQRINLRKHGIELADASERKQYKT